ncbi:MAG: hypothetical protein LBC85_00465 [Fibromonadaceae bacterium]|jgi:hypothetical protein|nr:hypothetical protein [Fibromonadaceae bacterium]
MQPKLPKLPTGIQTFANIREEGCVELFKGLYAEEFLNRPGFEPSPVIRLDMSGVATYKGFNDFDGAAKQNIKYQGYKMTAQEWLCRSCLLAFLRGCGVVVSGEVQTNRGKADLANKKKKRQVMEWKAGNA